MVGARVLGKEAANRWGGSYRGTLQARSGEDLGPWSKGIGDVVVKKNNNDGIWKLFSPFQKD